MHAFLQENTLAYVLRIYTRCEEQPLPGIKHNKYALLTQAYTSIRELRTYYTGHKLCAA